MHVDDEAAQGLVAANELAGIEIKVDDRSS
jgi:hypothetical protein